MSKICNKCNTENEDKFTYCKNCGNPLNDTLSDAPQTENQYYDNEKDFQNNRILPEIDGISNKDFSAYIGKNSFKILTKFSKMTVTDSKVSWCWPVAILSLLFGMAGTGIWFCYRKMYKLGAVLIAAGIAISVIFTAMSGVVIKDISLDVIDSASKYFTTDMINGNEVIIERQVVQSFLNDVYDIAQNHLRNYTGYTVLLFIKSFIKPTCFIVFGIFSLYIYKRNCIKKIKIYREKNQQNEYYYYGLSAMGGTSGAAVVLAVVIWILLSSAIENIIYSSMLSQTLGYLINFLR